MDQDRLDERALDQLVASKLKVTWDAFFAQHGRLREAQRMAALPILRGENVLITAPTASGKTEAAIAPLIERFHGRKEPWMVVYIIPTRALVNDLYHRLFQRCQQIGVTVARRTGEYKSVNNVRPHILLTTPESFDSMMCRGRVPGGHVLLSTRAVVLDEIHLLAETGRGEQVRWLIERLRRLKLFGAEKGWVAENEVQIVALSASLQDPDEIVRRFLREGTIVRSSSQRPIEQISPENMHEDSLTRVPSILQADANKVLVFCNARGRVDELCSQLKQTIETHEVVGHHGSLSKSLREDSEETLKTGDRVLAISTSTLEIGIDVGDIDIVGLDAPAYDISALLQRIGRGNRRTSSTKVLCCSRAASDPLIHEAMLYCAALGKFGGGRCGTQFGAAAQQLASFIFQSPNAHRQRDALVQLAAEMLDRETAEEIVDGLIASGALEMDGSGVKLGERLAKKAELGEIHSVIEEPIAMDVRDADTGQLIAKSVAGHPSNRIAIAGRPMTVQEQVGNTIHVKKFDGQRDNDVVKYEPTRPSPKASQAYAVRTFLGFEPDEWPVVQSGDCLYAFHLCGYRVRMLLDLNWPKGFPGQVTDFALILPRHLGRNKPDWFSEIVGAETRRLVFERVESLEHALVRPKANSHLSRKARAQEVCSWLDIDGTIRHIRTCRFNLEPKPEQREALMQLIN